MDIEKCKEIVATMAISEEEKELVTQGCLALLKMGWPPAYIDRQMCSRATAGLVRRYWGLSNWIAYCREWGMEAPTVSSIMRPF